MHAMIIRSITAIAAATVLTLAVAATSSVAARPDPDEPMVRVSSVITTTSCPLRRIGTQLVRGDNFTGAGVAAAAWIPELGIESGGCALG